MRVKWLAAAIAMVATMAAPAAADVIDRVLAIVAGTVITQSDVAAAISFHLVPPAPGTDPLRSALDYLIRRELILAEVSRYASVADPGEVANKMREIQASFASPADYRAALDRTAMDETRLRDMVDANVRIEEYMRQRFGSAEPTDEELSAYYAAHRAQFTSGGVQMTFEQARSAVRERFIDARRAERIDEWVTRLRRRAEVTDLYFADSRK